MHTSMCYGVFPSEVSMRMYGYIVHADQTYGLSIYLFNFLKNIYNIFI